MAQELFKILHNLSPVYLQDLVNFKVSNYNFRRENQAEVPLVNSTNRVSRAFIESMFGFQHTRPQTTLLLFDGYIILLRPDMTEKLLTGTLSLNTTNQHYINALKQELSRTKAYKETSEEEKSVVNGHCNHLALKFSVCVTDAKTRLPTMYWLPKLHKRPYKARFIANSSSCTTTELSKLLTSCLTAVKNHVIRYCEKVYEKSGKNLSTYDFSTLYTTFCPII